jgi:hypothetical protein
LKNPTFFLEGREASRGALNFVKETEKDIRIRYSIILRIVNLRFSQLFSNSVIQVRGLDPDPEFSKKPEPNGFSNLNPQNCRYGTVWTLSYRKAVFRIKKIVKCGLSA